MVWRRVLRIVGGGLLFGITVFVAFFKRVDYRPLHEQSYYQSAMQSVDKNKFAHAKKGEFKVGWNKRNITPAQPAHLMGYGWKGDYQQVHDSLWVRAFVFQMDSLVVGLVSYDLMLTPPLVAQKVKAALSNLPIDHIYFTATHTHNGYGSWEQGLGRELITGWYDSSLIALLVDQTTASLQEAYQELLPGHLAYASFNLDSLVNNRLVKGGAVEPFLRAIYFQRQDSSRAILSSFSAHATFVTSKSRELSGDYPGELVRQLEHHPSVDFALFSAGAVGSHSPHKPGPFSYQKLQNYANHLAEPLLNTVDQLRYESVTQIGFSEIALPLGEPQLRIAKNWRLRPYWFQVMLGKHSPTISLLQLGSIKLIGTPGDFSGLLYDHIEASKVPIIITSFNGEYIGYLIPSEYYHLNHRETRSINWYGSYTGDYATSVINEYLDIIQ